MLLMLVNSIRLSLHGVVLLVAWSRSFEHIASTLWLIALLCGLNMAVTCAFRHVKPNYTCDPYISHTLPIIIDQYYPSPFCFWAWEGATSLVTLNTLVSASLQLSKWPFTVFANRKNMLMIFCETARCSRETACLKAGWQHCRPSRQNAGTAR